MSQRNKSREALQAPIYNVTGATRISCPRLLVTGLFEWEQMKLPHMFSNQVPPSSAFFS